MGRTQYYCAMSLDGYIADADDGIDWLTGYEGSYAGRDAEAAPMGEGGSYEGFYSEVGALVSGSVTYGWVLENLPGPWPYQGKPWWVLTSGELSVRDGEGVDVRSASGDPAALHAEMLASAGGRNLWVLGGGGVASQFAGAGLLDELLVTVVPVVLGEGKPLFGGALAGPPLKLLETHAFDNGMVELRYALRP